VLIRDIDPDLLSEAGVAANLLARQASTTTGNKVAQTVGLGAGAAGTGTIVGHEVFDQFPWLMDEIHPPIPYTYFDIAVDLGLVGIGVVAGAFGGPAGEVAAIAANATRIQKIGKVIGKILKVFNPIEKLAAAGVSTKAFFYKMVSAGLEAMTFSLALNTVFAMVKKYGISIPSIPDTLDKYGITGPDGAIDKGVNAVKKVFKEDGEMQPTQDQIRDPAWCAANGIEPTIDPALEKDPAFVDAFIAARHYHKSIVKYNGKIYPVYLETDYDGPDAPSGFTLSESADLARIKLLTRKLLNG
jgi:hypothetical protein